MLHFLAGIALCIFIGERLVRWWRAWRLHRAVRRHLAMRYGRTTAPAEWRAFAGAMLLLGAVIVAPLLLAH